MFLSREDAGKLLAQKLIQDQITADVVIGLPRGGVVVAKEIAQILKLPVDTLMVKKISAPTNPELAIGAVSLNHIFVINQKLLKRIGIDKNSLDTEILQKSKELEAREQILRKGKSGLQIFNKNVILTDDGVATGATIYAAIKWLRKFQAKSIILCLPIAPKEIVKKLQQKSDICIILKAAENLRSVGEYYQDFREVSDQEVVKILT